jgi:hypothetical protein
MQPSGGGGVQSSENRDESSDGNLFKVKNLIFYFCIKLIIFL